MTSQAVIILLVEDGTKQEVKTRLGELLTLLKQEGKITSAQVFTSMVTTPEKQVI